jgi:hypothetical protein
MNDGVIQQVAARVRNLFVPGTFQKRCTDGKVQAITVFGRVIEKPEAFPYGFKARATRGPVLLFCQGGNVDSVELLPALDYGGGPDLNDGDSALYTEAGNCVVCRADGGIELTGKTGSAVIDKAGVITVKGTAIALQDGGLPAARQTDPVLSTVADDPPFWQWISTVSAAVAALTGGSLPPPTALAAKITGGSAAVTIG